MQYQPVCSAIIWNQEALRRLRISWTRVCVASVSERKVLMAERNPQPESHLVPLGPLAPGQRWSLARKREVALRLLRGEPLEALSRELGVEVYRLERWKDKALAGLDAGLKEREGDPLQSQLDAAMRRIGELFMENELLHSRIERPGPLAGRRSKR